MHPVHVRSKSFIWGDEEDAPPEAFAPRGADDENYSRAGEGEDDEMSPEEEEVP